MKELRTEIEIGDHFNRVLSLEALTIWYDFRLFFHHITAFEQSSRVECFTATNFSAHGLKWSPSSVVWKRHSYFLHVFRM